MTEPNLIEICAIAFAAVMVLLTLLALMTQAILWLFPFSADASTSAKNFPRNGSAQNLENRSAETEAIQSAVQKLAPGWRVSQLELLDNKTETRPEK